MKRLLFLLITVFYCSGLLSQSCSQNNIYVSNQFLVDIFDCSEVSGNLYIREGWNVSDTLQHLNGLSELTYIGGDLIIDSNSILENLNGLQNLDTIMGNLHIEEHNTLGDLGGLNNLKFVGGNVVIRDNDKLINFEGLNGLTYIGGGFDIGGFSTEHGNDGLINLSGLENLTFVGGTLQIRLNQILQDLSGLENLTSIGIYNESSYSIGLYIYNNSLLNNINALAGLNTLGGWLIFGNNYSLNSLSGLESLTVADRVSIHDNTNLTDINGLVNLTTVNGSISINDNANLTNIDGLVNIDYTSIIELSIHSNPNLSTCKSVCNYLENGGIATIYDNATGCNNDSEIIQSCFLPVEMSTPLQAHLQNQTAHLTWRTETETNNAGFEIQRSKDGIQWQRIGWQAGQGNTSTPYSYTYTDENPLSGTSYYRLKQLDFDGNFSYSNIADLHYERNTSINVYPNPVRDMLYINTELPVQQAIIFDTTGKSINAQISNNAIDVSTLNAGIYTLQITIGDGIFYEKILVK